MGWIFGSPVTILSVMQKALSRASYFGLHGEGVAHGEEIPLRLLEENTFVPFRLARA